MELFPLPTELDAALLRQADALPGTSKAIPELCAHRLFERQARVRAQTVAVRSSDHGSLTYGQLDSRADAIASWILGHDLPEEAVIGVLGERSPDFLAAILGIWKAGAAYLPLDPHWPSSRLKEALRRSACQGVLTASATTWVPEPDGEAAAPWLAAVSELMRGPDRPHRRSPQPADHPERLAYVIFTSGSTGSPKGAMIEHRGMMNHLLEKIDYLGLSVSDCVLQNAPQIFDISVWQLIAPLIAGGEVHIVGDRISRDPVGLLDEVESAGATIAEVVPSMLRSMIEQVESGSRDPGLKKLRWLIVTGEELTPDLCRRWLRRYPAIPLVNAYGPTECSDDVTHQVIDSPPDRGVRRMPIGHALANLRPYVLRQVRGQYRLCRPGQKGELFVAGPGVGRGYINDLDRTREAFFLDPFQPGPGHRIYKTGDLVRTRPDGALEFLGRVDHQVKLRGHRIELEEIEAALRQHPHVEEAVVCLAGEAADGPHSRLVAFVAPRWRNAPSIASHPRQQLPNGMAIARLTRSEADFLYADIFHRQAYTRHGLSIRPGQCVVDVGGNLGIFALFAHEQTAGGRIYCFEPIPELYELMRANLRLYGVDAETYQYGLGKGQGAATITYYPGFSSLSGIYPDLNEERAVALSFVRHRREHEPELALESEAESLLIEDFLEDRFRAETREIALTTLSAFIDERGVDEIDFLKVNVEGSELDVLLGIEDRHWPRIGQIALEIHNVDDRVRKVQDLLAGRGFDVAVEQDWSLEQTMKSNFYVYGRRPAALPRKQPRLQRHELDAAIEESRVLTDTELRAFLAERLPEHMTPAEYHFVESFPLGPTGKVDRRQLAEQGTAVTAAGVTLTVAAPRTELERALTAIWQDVLGVPRIGIHQNFFDSGGHSLLGARLMARIRGTYGIEVPLSDLFDHPTVARLAALIESHPAQ